MKLNYLNDPILLFFEENSCLMNKSEWWKKVLKEEFKSTMIW